jgi:hypothetical protein
MSETEIDAQCEDRKISKLANAALLCMIAEYGLFLNSFVFVDFDFILPLLIYPMAILLLVTPILCICALVYIAKSKGRLYGYVRVIITIIMSLLLTVFLFMPIYKNIFGLS